MASNMVKWLEFEVYDDEQRTIARPIGLDQVLCIILYTDYSSLCTDFSSTFRKLHTFESMQSIKMRHQKYCHLSMGLRAAVNYWGDMRLKGPFYCGMSMVMNMPQFSITVLSPTSTSVQIAVSLKFSGQEGILVQFGFESFSPFRCGLDVSWISRFKEEDERYTYFYIITNIFSTSVGYK